MVLLFLLWSTGNGHGQSAVSIITSGNRTNQDLRKRELGRLMDSLQTALGLTAIDCVPIEVNGNRRIQQFDRDAFVESLIEMRDKLGLSFDIPNRINANSVGPLLFAVLEAAKEQPPVVQTLIVTQVAQLVATLHGAVTDDGRQDLTHWGFKMGTDSSLVDSIHVLFSDIPVLDGDYQGFLDTSVVDTGVFYLDQTGLNRYTTYYYAAWGKNAKGMGFGDTLSFRTLPDLASGLTLDTADVLAHSARLTLSITDAGGQGPDSVGFAYATTDFGPFADALASLASDSTGGTFHSGRVENLTRYTTYYFNAYADNLAGRATASANKSFRTLPEVPSLSTVDYDFTNDELLGFVSDLGGDAGLPLPVATGFLWGADADLATFADEAGTFDSNDSTFRASITGLDAGEFYYFASYATNQGGTGYSDTTMIATPALVFTGSEVMGLTDTSFTVAAVFDYESAAPTSVGFVWGTDAALSASSDSTILMLPDSTATLVIDDATTGTYYYSAFAETAEGNRRYGDTLSFYFPIPLNDDNIQAAVDLWVSDQSTAESTYGHISDWYTGSVTDMTHLFYTKSTFNEDISGWDVSEVTTMKGMFRKASAFNQNIGAWNTSKVTSMTWMFREAASFNQPIGQWDVSAVGSMDLMFGSAHLFDQDLNGWNVGSVTRMDQMFNGASAFNGNVGEWDVQQVTTMSRMFAGASNFNQDIGEWDVSAVGNFEYTFQEAFAFNQPIGQWDVSAATNMGNMFLRASDFNRDIGTWDVSNVTTFAAMFQQSTAFNQDIGAWQVGSAQSFENMFYLATSFDQDLNDWTFSSGASLAGMFGNCTAFNGAIDQWDLSEVVNTSSMFGGATSFNQDISDWNVSNVTSMVAMFDQATSFNQDIRDWNVSNVTSMENTFKGANAFNQDIGNWNVSSVNNMMGMFHNNTAFNHHLGNWDVSGVTAMHSMFSNSALSRENYQATLAGWSDLALQNGVTFQLSAKICNTTDREYIAATFDWVITDGGIDSGCPVELPVVLTQAADSMKTAATLNAWLLYDGNSAVSATGFKWGQQPDLGDAQDAAGSATSGAFEAELTGLDIETKYYFTAYATNSEGTTYGDTLSFTTTTYPPVVLSDPATDLNHFAGTIHGKVTDDGGYAISATGIKWGLQADLSGAADTILTMAADSTFATALTGLEENTTYYFSAYATNAKGTNFGDTLSFTTPCYQFPSTLQGCDAGALTSLNYQGYDYTLVEIDGKCLFAESLRSEYYNDGTTAIPSGLDDSAWATTAEGASAIYDQGGANEAFNLAKNGRLYNWHAVNTGNLCPAGWHVPSDPEWMDLTDFLNTDVVKMKSASCWNGTNESGFSALPGGYRSSDGSFLLPNEYFWWSSTAYGAQAWFRSVGGVFNILGRSRDSHQEGMSVRCLRDPMVVETSDATDVGGDTGTLQGKVLHDGGSNLVATGFKWGLQADLSGAADTVVTMAADSTFAAVLTGLTTGSIYYFSAYSTNASGTVYGDTLSFTTPCDPFPSGMQGCDFGTLTSLSFDDYDYRLVEIGGQCWFAENLRSENYANGDAISPFDANNTDLIASTDGIVFNYYGDLANLESYGRLYNWYAANETRGLCPLGWHVPSQNEFDALATYLGGSSEMGGKMKSASCWDGTNESGFSALPGGYIQIFGGLLNEGENGHFWTTSTAEVSYPFFGTVTVGLRLRLDLGVPEATTIQSPLREAASVRCVRDDIN